MSSFVTMKQLLEAGTHFGHQTRRWNPKMAPYIFTARGGIYIIDLLKTLRKLNEATAFVKKITKEGQGVIFVGTKSQARESIKTEAERCGAYYVNFRWLGGMLTNFSTIQKRVGRLKQLRHMESDGTFEALPKKEVSKLKLEIKKLERYLCGVKKMKELPGAIFIIDPKKESIAVLEAKKLKIPIISVVDTNCDPDPIDYPIPGNDDAVRSIKLICSAIASSIFENKEGADITENSENINSSDDKIVVNQKLNATSNNLNNFENKPENSEEKI